MNETQIFWGETHDNVFMHEDCPVSLEENFAAARSHLDFYAPAMYTAANASVPMSPAPLTVGPISKGSPPVATWKSISSSMISRL